MAVNIESLLKVILPQKAKPQGTSLTSTFNPSSTDTVLSLPQYRDHLDDIFTTRVVSDSRELMRQLMIHDPDVSAAVNAYLTVANTEPVFVVKDVNNVVDREGQKTLNMILTALTTQFDYKVGFEWKQSIRAISENMRYMILMRGAVAAELVLNKQQLPYQIRQVDPATIEWFERLPGIYKPQQAPPGSNDKISLDVPTFFVSFYRRDPTSIYTYSPFVSSINTVAARQQVINDLYRIMRFTGYPRIEVTVMEDVLKKRAPANIMQDAEKLNSWVTDQLNVIRNRLSDLRADQAFVHTDSVEAKILNEKGPASSMNVTSVVDALNAQNQAALRSMATILGRGEVGVNTASVEARIFSMNAEEINEPVGEIWSQMLTMAIRLLGHDTSHVECRFRPAELRPELELEPQLTMRSARLREDLSLGIITDDEYHLEMYGRIRPDEAPELSGTGFQNTGVSVNTQNVTPNSDPLGRSLVPEGSGAARGNNIKK
jgi:hypothetical protein